jgi:hypothetical protein
MRGFFRQLCLAYVGSNFKPRERNKNWALLNRNSDSLYGVLISNPTPTPRKHSKDLLGYLRAAYGLLTAKHSVSLSDKPRRGEEQGRNPQRGENPEPRPGDDRAELEGDEED